jgi:hypothetical protein
VLSWLIVGGGIHGTLLSRHLTAAGVARDRLRVLDPDVQPLDRWNHRTEATGMQGTAIGLTRRQGRIRVETEIVRAAIQPLGVRLA